MKVDITMPEVVIDKQFAEIKLSATEAKGTKAKIFINGKINEAPVIYSGFKFSFQLPLSYGENPIQINMVSGGEHVEFKVNITNKQKFVLNYDKVADKLVVDKGLEPSVTVGHPGFIIRDTVWVPLKKTLKPLSIDVEYVSSEIIIYANIKYQDRVVTVASHKKELALDGKTMKIPVAPEFIDGEMYVPAEMLKWMDIGFETVQETKGGLLLICLH